MTKLEVRTEEFRKEGSKLLGLDNRRLVLDMRRDLRVAAKPIGQQIIDAYVAAAPHRGGFSERIRQRAKSSVLVDLKRGVKLQIGATHMKLSQLTAGVLRHPAWPHGADRKAWSWKTQPIPTAGVGKRIFDANTDMLQLKVLDAVTRTVRKAV